MTMLLHLKITTKCFVVLGEAFIVSNKSNILIYHIFMFVTRCLCVYGVVLKWELCFLYSVAEGRGE